MSFRLAVLGDSIQWGQGLLEEDKFSHLVRNELEQTYNGSWEVVRYAHSGSVIGGKTTNNNAPSYADEDWSGEVPSSSATVSEQLNTLAKDYPEEDAIHLILLDGGINDIFDGKTTLERLISPYSSKSKIRDGARWACYSRTKRLMKEADSKFPRSCVVVTGYYPIFSAFSLVSYTAFYVLSRASLLNVVIPSPLLALAQIDMVSRLIKRSNEWSDAANEALEDAVHEVNEETQGEQRFGYARANFAPKHCLFSPLSRLWGIGLSADFPALESWSVKDLWNWITELGYEHLTRYFGPLDPLEEQRKSLCGSDFICRYASVGHPNAAGAREFKRTILAELETLPFARMVEQTLAMERRRIRRRTRRAEKYAAIERTS